MLARRLRRRSNIKSTLSQRIVLAGIYYSTAKRQYLITCELNRYCRLTLHSSVHYILGRSITLLIHRGGGPRVVVSTAAFHARVRGSVPVLGGLTETKMFLTHPRVKVSIVGSLRDREVACSASDRQGSNSESCVWRTVPSQ